MTELSSSMKKRPMKMLLNVGSTGKFISNAMATALKLRVQDDKDFHEFTLANGIVVPSIGYVQFVMNFGDYKCKIVVRVFPNLHK